MSNDRRRRRPRDVRGLAPLELVLALPILVFLAALMVNFGTAANWKLRGLVVARQQLWGSRLVPNVALGGTSMTPDYTQPVPAFWQAAAGIVNHTNPGDNNELVNQNVDENTIGTGTPMGAVVRGAEIGRFTFSPQAIDLLDPATGLHTGSAQVSRLFPFFGRWPAFQVDPQNQLLSDPWPYWDPRMKWNDASTYKVGSGLKSNLDVRIPALYTEPQASSEYSSPYLTAQSALFNFYNANATSMALLESIFPDFDDVGSPNAYPFIPNPLLCQTDYKAVNLLVDNPDPPYGYIQYLPLYITQQIKSDLKYYNDQIAADQAALQDGQNADPPMPSDQQAELQAQITEDQSITSALQNLLSALGSM